MGIYLITAHCLTIVLGLKVSRKQTAVAVDEYCTLHKVLELAHVAHKRQRSKVTERIGCKLHRLQAVERRVGVGKMTHKKRYILPALAQ